MELLQHDHSTKGFATGFGSAGAEPGLCSAQPAGLTAMDTPQLYIMVFLCSFGQRHSGEHKAILGAVPSTRRSLYPTVLWH